MWIIISYLYLYNKYPYYSGILFEFHPIHVVQKYPIIRSILDDEDEDRIGNEDTDNEDEGYSKEDFDDEPDDLGALEEVEDDDVNGDDADDEKAAAAFDSDLDFSIEGIKAAADEEHEFQSFAEDDAAEEYISIPGVNEIDDNSAEPLEEVWHIQLFLFAVCIYKVSI